SLVINLRKAEMPPGSPAGATTRVRESTARDRGAMRGRARQPVARRRHMLMRTAEPEQTAPVAGAAPPGAAVGAPHPPRGWYCQYVLHYQPCPLCLEQRISYYVGIPLAVVVALAARLRAPRRLLIAGLAAIALAMFIGAGLAVYHAGVEWHLWAGPAECSG